MFIGKKDTKAIIFALYLASQWEDSVVDAHTFPEWSKPESEYDKINKEIINRCKKNIKEFDEIREKLKRRVISSC